MRARAVPVALDGLGVEAHVDVELLADALEQPAGDPHLVTDLDGAENAELELPLTHHHFGVRALDRDAGADAGQRVRLDDLAPGHLRSAHAAVVGALGGGEAHLGPAVGSLVLEERVLLLDAEHRLEAGVLLGRFERRRARVGDVRGHVRIQDLAHDEHVLGSAQGIGERRDRVQHAVREVTGGLVGARSIEAPHRWLLPVGHDLRLAA